MDIEQLWGILHKERSMATLQELPDGFCEDVGRYIGQLAAEKCAVDERRAELVEDEIRNARMKVEDIVRRRIGKIVKLASSGSRTLPRGMLAAEEEIFTGVKRHVDEGKERLLALMLDQRGSAASAAQSELKRSVQENVPKAQHSVRKAESGSNEEEKEQPQHPGKREEQPKSSWNLFRSTKPTPARERGEELHIVRILDDLPPFMGIDGRIYKLKREDVILLPKTNAEILCKRGVAERFEGEIAPGGGEHDEK
ncbi:MAG TPA: DNA replication complex GINS family protein [Methanomicrobia archaeon]|mgnify:CR=1 FL=1|nr:DNA replication complex GINS family protein [Methanomicrobia archaeon]